MHRLPSAMLQGSMHDIICELSRADWWCDARPDALGEARFQPLQSQPTLRLELCDGCKLSQGVLEEDVIDARRRMNQACAAAGRASAPLPPTLERLLARAHPETV